MKIKKKINYEIDPDEIFLDSTNLPDFDTQQFEGSIEKPISKKAIISLGLFFSLIIVIFSIKIFFLQVISGENYFTKSNNNRLKHSDIFAERGIIYDRNGIELAWNTASENGDPYSKRNYLNKEGLGHTLGYVNYPQKDKSGNYYKTETNGINGVEKLFDEKLKGINGLKISETDALGKIQSELTIRPPKDGDNLYLTIDSDLQNFSYKTIKTLAEKVGFKGGGAIIMDINSGEILAITSYPEYNSDIISNEAKNETLAKYLNDSKKPFLNRISSGLYIPGSIIKPFMALAALNEKVITPEKEILSTGSISLPNPYNPGQKTIFKDWKAHGWVNMRRALAVSSDVFFYEIGGGYQGQKGIGIKNIDKYMKIFGFSEPTGAEVISEEIGVIPTPEWKKEIFKENWTIGNTYHTSIGQYGFQVTPLQVVKATATLATNGIAVIPVITASSTKNNSKKIITEIKEKDYQIVKEGMRMAVTEGTAQGLSVPFVKIAGKTGTAELGISKRFVNSWIIGFFPYEKPKYAFAVIMEEGPKENLVGGTYVMRQIIDWIQLNKPEYFK